MDNVCDKCNGSGFIPAPEEMNESFPTPIVKKCPKCNNK